MDAGDRYRRNGTGRSAAAAEKRLERVTFETSRAMDFFSEKELITQTGHGRDEWPLVIAKELLDNALDACEDGDIAPALCVAADACGITVTDNGPGLPEATLEGALDFTIRVSNREAYVSPCRGAQGNALKTLLPMPWVLDPDRGKFVVTARGKQHVITCGADPISQEPVIGRDRTDQALAGTRVRLEWGSEGGGWESWPFDLDEEFPARFRELVEGFAVFNPHATITLDWFGEKTAWGATSPAWKKWKPHQPTSPGWYELRHLESLIGRHITHGRRTGVDRLVSEFISEFDGLTGSGKRTTVLTETGLKRARLSEFVKEGRLDSARIARLLAAMQKYTKPVKARRLGLIGEGHLRERLLAMGVTPKSFRYDKQLHDPKSKKSQIAADEKPSFLGVPYVLEAAFGWLGKDARDRRRIYAGANWSAAIKNPFRVFGSTGEGLETLLADRRATWAEPVVFVLHLAHPRVEYTDRGKSALVIGGDA